MEADAKWVMMQNMTDLEHARYLLNRAIKDYICEQAKSVGLSENDIDIGGLTYRVYLETRGRVEGSITFCRNVIPRNEDDVEKKK